MLHTGETSASFRSFCDTRNVNWGITFLSQCLSVHKVSIRMLDYSIGSYEHHHFAVRFTSAEDEDALLLCQPVEVDAGSFFLSFLSIVMRSGGANPLHAIRYFWLYLSDFYISTIAHTVVSFWLLHSSHHLPRMVTLLHLKHRNTHKRYARSASFPIGGTRCFETKTETDHNRQPIISMLLHSHTRLGCTMGCTMHVRHTQPHMESYFGMEKHTTDWTLYTACRWSLILVFVAQSRKRTGFVTHICSLAFGRAIPGPAMTLVRYTGHGDTHFTGADTNAQNSTPSATTKSEPKHTTYAHD